MYVTDLNSTNGTMVNGVELSPMDNVAVEVGQEVTFGERQLASLPAMDCDWRMQGAQQGAVADGQCGGGGRPRGHLR